MSRSINQETRKSIRHEVVSAVKAAAKADNLSVNAEDLAFLSEPSLMFVNAPVAGVEKLDFKAIFDGHPVLDNTPIMYWHLSGDSFEEKSAIPAGFYTVVAHGKRGAVSLRDAEGKTLAEGDLQVAVGPPMGTSEKLIDVSITEVHFGKNHFKICGSLDVDIGPVSVHVNGCMDVQKG